MQTLVNVTILTKEMLNISERLYHSTMRKIIRQIRTNFCAPDEFLMHKGDAISNIYYLFNGSMEVLQDGMVVAILGKFW